MDTQPLTVDGFLYAVPTPGARPGTELPAPVLARTLGIDITVAVNWQRAPPAIGAPMRPRSAAETRKPDLSDIRLR